MDIRSAEPSDLPALTAIYNHYVEHSHVTFDVTPFSVEERRPWFEQHEPAGRHRLLVAVDSEVVGYAASGRWRARPAYDSTVEVSFYCAAAATRRGLGSALLSRLLGELAGEDVQCVVGGAALPNPGSIALFERFGFRSVGVFRQVGRKFGRYFDVQWFEKQLR
jgi:phosphinothricin acetyltransferase